MKISRICTRCFVAMLLVAAASLPSCQRAPAGETQDAGLLPLGAMLEMDGRQELVGHWLQVVGVSVAPIVGIAAAGTLGYYRLPPERRSGAFLLYRPAVWITMWLLTGVLLFKDFVLTFFGALKTPLDAVALIADGAAAVLGLGFLLPVLLGHNPTGGDLRLIAADIAMSAAMVFFYLTVWTTFSAVNVLIMLNPLPLVDSALRTVQYGIVTFLFAVALFSPGLGLLAASPVLVFSVWAARRSLRFTRMGLTFAFDTLGRRWRYTRLSPEMGVLAFPTRGVRGMKANRAGRLFRAPDGSLQFRYRRGVVGPTRAVPVTGIQTGPCRVGKGLLAPCIVGEVGESRAAVLFRLPPRYRGHEAGLAPLLGLPQVVEVSAARGLRTLLQGAVTFARPAVAG